MRGERNPHVPVAATRGAATGPVKPATSHRQTGAEPTVGTDGIAEGIVVDGVAPVGRTTERALEVRLRPVATVVVCHGACHALSCSGLVTHCVLRGKHRFPGGVVVLAGSVRVSCSVVVTRCVPHSKQCLPCRLVLSSGGRADCGASTRLSPACDESSRTSRRESVRRPASHRVRVGRTTPTPSFRPGPCDTVLNSRRTL